MSRAADPTRGWWDDGAAWRSGPWTAQVRGAELADIRHRGLLVLRGVEPVIRDADWGTVPARVAGHREAGGRFEVEVVHEGLGVLVTSVLAVHAGARGLEVSWEARPARGYDTCRTGLVVLHPPSVAGAPARVTHPGGGVTRTAFPGRDISPHQPMRGITALAWVHRGVEARLALDGDVFEMEDQRNWTDASFKTYNRPLDLPFPYRLEAGETVRQSLTLTVARVTPAQAAGEPRVDVLPPREEPRIDAPSCSRGPMGIEPARIELGPADGFPAIGLEASTAPDPAPRIDTIGQLRVVELDLATAVWPAALDRAAATKLPLDLRLVLPAGGVAQASREALAERLAGLPVLRVGAFDRSRHITDAAAAEAARAIVAAAGLEAQILAGSRSHFTELNREAAALAPGADALTTTVTPLFHATSTAQLVESVAMQRLVAEQAVRMAGGRPVHLGPVSLRPRFNNVATRPQPAPARPDLAEGHGAQFTGVTDPRQGAPELAAWTIASAAALAVPGVASLAYYEDWGPRGVHDTAGTPRPAAAALTALTALAGGRLLHGESPDGLLWALGARHGERTALLAANLDRRERRLALTLPGEEPHLLTLPPASWAEL